MPTTPQTRGRGSTMFVGFQTAFGTPAAADGYQQTPFYRQTLSETTPRESDPLLGLDQANGRDATDPVQGLPEHSGEVEVPLCLNHIGLWLRLALGDPTTTGDASDYQHVFTSGTPTLPTGTAEVALAANDVRQHVGLAVQSMRVNVADEAGTQRVTFAIAGQRENLLTATAAGIVPAMMPLAELKRTRAAVFLDGAALGALLACDFTYTTGVTMDRFVDGNDYPSEAALTDEATNGGTMRLRYKGQAFEQRAIADSTHALEFRWVISATRSISVLMPRVRFGRAAPPIEGPAALEQSIPFMAAQGAANMLTVTLKNGIASY